MGFGTYSPDKKEIVTTIVPTIGSSGLELFRLNKLLVLLTKQPMIL